MGRMKRVLLLALSAATTWAQMNEISGERIRAHVKFLASDLLEGRGVGARGGDLATEYIATQFALVGAKPAGDNGTYFQNFTLVGAAPQPIPRSPQPALASAFPSAGSTISWASRSSRSPTSSSTPTRCSWAMASSRRNTSGTTIKGVDVRGKVVVLFTNEPPSNDPKFFTGGALTYYGRWTYKYEEAARHGAVAAIIIHTTPTASYGWDVVRSSWGREDQQVKLAPGRRGAGFRRLGDARTPAKRIAATPGTDRRRIAASWPIRAAFRRSAAAAALPRHALREDPRDPNPQRGRQSGGQRSAVERRSRDFQRALGSSGHRRSR